MTVTDWHHVALGLLIAAGSLICLGVAVLAFILR